jgi:hypothetical protein
MFKNESCTICANTQRQQRQEAQRETSTGKLRRSGEIQTKLYPLANVSLHVFMSLAPVFSWNFARF